MNAILFLKYRPDRNLAQLMASWLMEIIEREKPSADLIVPVPLGTKRQRDRGYNQAAMIASELAKYIRTCFQLQALQRTRETESQVGLDEQGRASNVMGAFKASPELVAGHAIVLIDDLITTGATILSCTQALSEAGAKEVFAVAVGRTTRSVSEAQIS